MITWRLVITGKVQGVWYRDSMRIEADRLGVTGWVRNRHDGSVEAMVQGGETAIVELVAWARRGPPAATVADVSVTEGHGTYASFERLPTA